jgi:hypothetical protein
LSPALDPRRCIGKKKSLSKLKEVLVDEEVSLSVIDNREFITKRVAEKLWLVSTTTKDQLRDLVRDGLIQEKDFADWKVPGQHQVPTLLACFCFFHRFLHLSVFVHLCEAFIASFLQSLCFVSFFV